MKQCRKWEFKTKEDLDRFERKFHQIQEVFFPENTITTHISPFPEDKPTRYWAVLIDKKPNRKVENEEIDAEREIGQYDALTFMKICDTNQTPDKNSWMKRTKKIKEKDDKTK